MSSKRKGPLRPTPQPTRTHTRAHARTHARARTKEEGLEPSYRSSSDNNPTVALHCVSSEHDKPVERSTEPSTGRRIDWGAYGIIMSHRSVRTSA